MITVYYCYFRKRDGRWRKSFKRFDDVMKALRFIQSINGKNKQSFMTEYECDYPEDNEFIYSRI